ncbi:SDR family NAD(P)-dependent oxidoreductase [Methylobrevis pamukkalensis]|uniref:Putative oxidoreductase n=1 Tax=Methylobrevis pamukkalensis TaxID=1439726 RepID=A0A1E3H5B3_9HYPH|nr:SDR family oxidoreductase [Methylobrevis pamukkalensis]ODN71528.1 putative oxidoreductase [Methylobrevis pamukkalensis]
MTASSNTAVVTGASTGIGAVYADRLAARGHDLVLVARDENRLRAVAARLPTPTGRRVEVVAADLSTPAGLAVVAGRVGAADVGLLVNNAGIALTGPLAATDPARFRTMLHLNVTAVAELTRAAAVAMSARGHGTIVNVASVAALSGESPRISAGYTATKAFVLALTEGLAPELASSGVRIQAVLPGVTRTPIWELTGIDLGSLPDEIVMEAGDMVDAALAGLALGEIVTIPALPDAAEWTALTEARARLQPNLSRSRPADRYRRPGSAAEPART